MFLRCSTRKKDGKEHHYWSLVENRRLTDSRVVQRHVLYLGEINDNQQVAWRRSIEIFDQGEKVARTVALVAAERQIEQDSQAIVRIRVDEMELRRPRQWGGCWLACELYHQLELDQFFSQRLAANRKGTRWDLILQTLVCYRLLDPGSEWRLHRLWFEQSAMGDLLGEDYALVEKNALYRCLDKVLAHKHDLFGHLQRRWQDLFGARFDVLLYDLTSTYFESDPPADETDKRRYGYSRDKRGDCVQVVVAPTAADHLRVNCVSPGETPRPIVGPGGATQDRIAPLTSSRPPVMVVVARAATGSTVLRSTSFTPAVSIGHKDSRRAAAPETCGVAIEVPLKKA